MHIKKMKHKKVMFFVEVDFTRTLLAASLVMFFDDPFLKQEMTQWVLTLWKLQSASQWEGTCERYVNFNIW